VIGSAAASTTYGATFEIATASPAAIRRVALVRLGAVTHSVNMEQRYVPLQFSAGSSSLTATSPANANIAPPGVYMLFIVDANGVPSVARMVSVTGNSPPAVTLTQPAANGAQAMAMRLDLTGTTQFGADNDVKQLSQNGYTSGSLLGFSVNGDGTIVGSYSNEQTKPLGQIVMAAFGNVEGLKPEGDNVWSATGASGQPLVGVAGGSMGTLRSNAVEASNVDLSGQLVNLIVAQRNYQANAQTIKAQDTVMQTLVNL